MQTCATCGADSEGAFRYCPRCGAALTGTVTSREQRKTVTVLFCDLAGSTAMGETIDPERLRVVLAGHFEQMKTIVERHGGSVDADAEQMAREAVAISDGGTRGSSGAIRAKGNLVSAGRMRDRLASVRR